jgi:hypothetical protein
MDPLDEFFKAYETAFFAPDTEAIAEAYAYSFMVSSATDVSCITNDHRFRAVLMQAAAFYHSIGMRSAKILTKTEIPIDNLHRMVDTEWALYREDGSELVRYDVGYLVRNFRTVPEIVFVIARNEEERLREKGLIPET